MTTNGHDARGRFVAGNPGGPGRPRRTVEFDYLAIMAEVVTPDEWRAVVKDALYRAKNRDARARDWLGKYLIGASVLVRVAPGAMPEEPTQVASIEAEPDDDEYWEELHRMEFECEAQEPPRISASGSDIPVGRS
jgi:hypothetical protein